MDFCLSCTDYYASLSVKVNYEGKKYYPDCVAS